MAPAKPPLPSCSYFPFQFPPAEDTSGIQTSMLMLESLAGLELRATRQNGGRPVSAVVEPGGVNGPGVTGCATVTVVCGSTREERLSHVAAEAGVAAAIEAQAATAARQFLSDRSEERR